MAQHKPPFTRETAHQKVKAAQALWNTRDPAKVAQAYTPTSIWRNRSAFLRGRASIEDFLTKKWEKEKEYRLRKELFAQQDNRICVQFWYFPFVCLPRFGLRERVLGSICTPQAHFKAHLLYLMKEY